MVHCFWLDFLWVRTPIIALLTVHSGNWHNTLSVGVLDQQVLNQRVKMYCVSLIPDGDAKRHKVYTGLGNWHPTSSLRDRSCIPCTEVLVVGGYKLGERGS